MFWNEGSLLAQVVRVALDRHHDRVVQQPVQRHRCHHQILDVFMMFDMRTTFSASTRANAGFTLIELALVIVVVSVIAALTIPRFIDTSHAARAAAIKSGAGAVVSALTNVHLKVQLTGIPSDSTVRQVDLGGGDMIDVRYGYPACTSNGIAKAAGTTKGFVWYMQGATSDMCTLYPDVGKNASGLPIYMSGCGVVYVN